MKIFHFTIIFAVFMVTMVIVSDMKTLAERPAKNNGQDISRIIESAVDTAAGELRSSETAYNDEKGKAAVDSFFYSLYAGCGIMDDPYKREAVKLAFPAYVIAVNGEKYLYKRDWWNKNIELKDIDLDTGFLTLFTGELTDPEDMFDTYRTDLLDQVPVFKASVTDRVLYVIDLNGWYHREGCGHCGETVTVLYSERGCADMGAKPCKYCINR